jgi:hypothetical protein
MMKHRCRAFILLSAVLLLSLAPLPEVAQSAAANFIQFGAVESYYRPEDAAEAGLAWDRIIFEWRYLQPDGPDDWETDRWDAWLRDAQRAGRHIVGLIKNAPGWATGSDLLGAPAQGLDLPIDDPGNRWATFIRRLVRYYSARWGIHDWIIYNEPDIRPGDNQNGFFEFAGDITDYYKTLKVAYKAAHAADPNAVIHLAGLTYWFDKVFERDQYLGRLLAVIRDDPEARKYNQFFDVLTVHAYGGTDWVWRLTQFMASILAEYGLQKPIWIGEVNVRPTQDKGWTIKGLARPKDPPISVDEQASFIVQSAALALSMGVQSVMFYRLYDNGYDSKQGQSYEAWGLIRPDGTRRPGFYALKMVNTYLKDMTAVQRVRNGGVTLVLLIQPDQTTYVLWNENNQPVTVQIKPNRNDETAKLISYTGDVKTVSPGRAGRYEFKLASCRGLCVVKGEPRLFVQPGRSQSVTVLAPDGTWSLH